MEDFRLEGPACARRSNERPRATLVRGRRLGVRGSNTKGARSKATTPAPPTMDRPPVANETALREIPSRFGESICVSSYVANPLGRSQNLLADSDGCDEHRAQQQCRPLPHDGP